MMNASLADQAYHHLFKGLFTGRLSAGDQISEVTLSKELKISRTPVREAIRRLQAEGLVNQIPKVGTFVRTPTRRELIELYEEREALESHLARRLARESDLKAAEKLLWITDEMSALVEEGEAQGGVAPGSPTAKRIWEIDLAFHDVLARAAGNQLIYRSLFDGRVMSGVFVGRRRLEHFIPIDEHRKAVREHRAIAEAIQSGDGDAAYKLMAEHVSLACDRSLSLLDSRQAIPKDARIRGISDSAESAADADDQLMLPTGTIRSTPLSAPPTTSVRTGSK